MPDMRTDFDPITFEVVKSGLDSIADQMALVLMRSAYSPIVRDSLDYSTAVFDRDGRMVAQGLMTALHMGSFPIAMRNLIATYGGRMKPGDMYLFNDPYGSGGMHLPDFYLIKPIFEGDQIEGYATALVHHTDVGGIAPGAIATHAVDIYQEGIRIPLLKLYDAGVLNDTLISILTTNVRVPKKVMGDLRAQISACHRGEHGFLELKRRYDPETFQRYLGLMQDVAESRMREAIAALPDGTYTFLDHIDGIGEDPAPIRFQLKVTIKGDEAVVDWTGTSPQVKAAINAPGPFVYSATYIGFRCLVQGSIPNAEGYMRPIKVIAPKGSIVNPDLPAAANARGITGFRVLDTVLGALAKAVPDRIPACGEGGAMNFGVGGVDKGGPYVFAETMMGAWGGRADRDGIDGASNLAANQTNQPIEILESENPLQITRYGFIPDSGGPGKHRGGLALAREYRLLADEGMMTFRTDRRAFPPYGINGGRSGTPSWNLLNPGRKSQRVLPVLPLEPYDMRKDDIFLHVLPGPGGNGSPLDRDPARVREDVLDEKITAAYARDVYGVALRGRDRKVDAKATAALRKRMARRKAGSDAHVALFQKALGLKTERKAPARRNGGAR